MDLLQKRKSSFSNSEKSSDNQAWERIQQLIHAESTEVTWNTSMFVSLLSSFLFLGLLCEGKESLKNPLQKWFTVFISVFLLQDLVVRWKAAHRKSAATYEKLSIIERLRWSLIRENMRINKTSWHEA
jgi:hypothetical protein